MNPYLTTNTTTNTVPYVRQFNDIRKGDTIRVGGLTISGEELERLLRILQYLEKAYPEYSI